MADEIIEELWKIKDDIAQEYGFNLDLLVAHLRAKERSTEQNIVNLDGKKILPQHKEYMDQKQPIEKPGT